jgi:uncharacterized protein (TIGR00730 family)
VTDQVQAAPPGDPTDPTRIDADIARMLDDAGIVRHADQISGIVRTALGMGLDRADRLNLKIANFALAEMREAFEIFQPYLRTPKVTIFGSARTRPDDPVYHQTHAVARAIAAQGWMVITGAGPGTMQAAMEGAGLERSLGVSIRLPFEAEANQVIAGDPKLVSMKYFFTRKLMLVKESLGFVAMPGGFGTLDEILEVLTLQQTGKAVPTPIVLLDAAGDTYWQGFRHFVESDLVPRGLVADDDLDRVVITDDVDVAVGEILGFWRNYDSLRWVGKRLVLRLRAEPTDEEVAGLNERFASLLAEGRIDRSGPLPPEEASADKLDLPRLVCVFDQWKIGSLHLLIRALNELATAPAIVGQPPRPA